MQKPPFTRPNVMKTMTHTALLASFRFTSPHVFVWECQTNFVFFFPWNIFARQSSDFGKRLTTPRAAAYLRYSHPSIFSCLLISSAWLSFNTAYQTFVMSQKKKWISHWDTSQPNILMRFSKWGPQFSTFVQSLAIERRRVVWNHGWQNKDSGNVYDSIAS